MVASAPCTKHPISSAAPVEKRSSCGGDGDWNSLLRIAPRRMSIAMQRVRASLRAGPSLMADSAAVASSIFDARYAGDGWMATSTSWRQRSQLERAAWIAARAGERPTPTSPRHDTSAAFIRARLSSADVGTYVGVASAHRL
eukprot:5010358-Prymnesium_polylepis.1